MAHQSRKNHQARIKCNGCGESFGPRLYCNNCWKTADPLVGKCSWCQVEECTTSVADRAERGHVCNTCSEFLQNREAEREARKQEQQAKRAQKQEERQAAKRERQAKHAQRLAEQKKAVEESREVGIKHFETVVQDERKLAEVLFDLSVRVKQLESSSKSQRESENLLRSINRSLTELEKSVMVAEPAKPAPVRPVRIQKNPKKAAKSE